MVFSWTSLFVITRPATVGAAQRPFGPGQSGAEWQHSGPSRRRQWAAGEFAKRMGRGQMVSYGKTIGKWWFNGI